LRPDFAPSIGDGPEGNAPQEGLFRLKAGIEKMSFFCVLSIKVTKAISIFDQKTLCFQGREKKEVMNQSLEKGFAAKNGGDGREDPIPIV
jgi:hypothetical protein